MKVIKNIQEIRQIVSQWKKDGLNIGLVPTMGYLHEGHGSLIQKAVSENDKVVVSIFVNPMQFGENEDLESYPRDLDRDFAFCENLGTDIIFNPEPSEMYSSGFCSFVDMNGLTKGLCGKTRPVHFRGVCTVVTKLFNIVTPNSAYFGQKDAQQLAVIRRMVKDLNIDINIVGCPIVRESDGLAKSSRNTYLNSEERSAAVILSKALRHGRKLIESGEKSVDKIIAEISGVINTEKLAKIDYVEVVNSENLERVSFVQTDVLVAVAVYIGKTRLIDNFSFCFGKE